MTDATLKFALQEIIEKLSQLAEMLDDDTPATTSDIPTIPFKDNPDFTIPEEWLTDWFCRYGELMVRKELVRCRHWCLDNPAKQKYCGKGYRPKSFIGNWLSRAAEKRGVYVSKVSNTSKYERKN
jgi:hypothetical protein